ncbi:hypothetical protein [Actinacidiphila oryziradicis]|uniref:Uncharacterized protein n=1 Tax=Actinacidiphila oryziradicis TaxID=2571141 RepID=A0A4U0SI70_9ACTN|nr:hypothetical protein [Actinacidiphila oryziradicis]TKA08568.1 hypothetical protein FCI23_26895 [Actinacidiphila oryziradicis]
MNVIAQDQRWTMVRHLVHGTDLDVVDRAAGLILLLFAQPPAASSSSPPTTSATTAARSHSASAESPQSCRRPWTTSSANSCNAATATRWPGPFTSRSGCSRAGSSVDRSHPHT